MFENHICSRLQKIILTILISIRELIKVDNKLRIISMISQNVAIKIENKLVT